MPLTFYKLIHLLGIFLVFAQIGGAVVATGMDQNSWKKAHGIMHGLGAFMLLLGGFGMLAKLDLVGAWPVWVWVKLVIWVLISLSPMAIRKAPEKARIWLFGAILLGVTAAYLALYKPF
jgi:hypothetical protein